MKKGSAIRKEQFRQARRLHGSLWKMAAAFLGMNLSRMWIPSGRLRLSLYRAVFNKRYPPGFNESESEKPLKSYPSLNALFTRAMKPECRPISTVALAALSPCDGTIQDVGKVNLNQTFTVKGVEHTLESLLPTVDIAPYHDGQYAIIFLTPVDCHRIFSPSDGNLESVIHVPGSRLPVDPRCQSVEYSVYSLNERMILQFSTISGPWVVVMVAGWGVGNISIPLVPHFKPHRRSKKYEICCQVIPVKRGTWVATFQLGSTVVLLLPAKTKAVPVVTSGEKIKYGQPIFTISS